MILRVYNYKKGLLARHCMMSERVTMHITEPEFDE